jgi:hypothetical protein
MNPTLKTALALREMGFAIHWLRRKEKIPLDAGWSEAPVASLATLESSFREGYNVGFRPGKWSVVDGHEIIVLDIDIRGGKPFAEEAYAVATTVLGGSFDPQVKTGSVVGRHQYLRTPKGTSPDKAATTLRQSDVWLRDGQICSPGTKEGKPAYLIEVLSTGKNVVLPPSIHPDTGRPYEFLTKGAWS